MYRISADPQNRKFFNSQQISLMSALHNSVVYVVGATIVMISRGDRFRDTRYFILVETESIRILASNFSFMILARANEGGKVIASSPLDSAVLCSIQLKGEKRLSTHGLDSIVCKTSRSIRVLSMTPVSIGRRDFTGPIV
jgi:hypothetical protein